MYSEQWGGIPDAEFLGKLAGPLGELHSRLHREVVASDQVAGKLSPEWAKKLDLPEGLPVAVGALDAHYGGVGSGVGKEILVKIMGTSTCDIMVYPDDGSLEDIPGVAGIVKDSVLPGYIGIEAGQSAVGDIFNWWVSEVLRQDEAFHQSLSALAGRLKAGQSGLLALDWNNGNRNILTDPDLTGLIIGQTLLSTDAEIYRALIEATAFGARRIVEQMETYGVKIRQVVNCGGIAEKNPLVMQIYANILGRPMAIARSAQTVALGAAIFGGLVALKGDPGYRNAEEIQQRVCRVKDTVYRPDTGEHKTYNQLYQLYQNLHDAFGISGTTLDLSAIMKELLQIKRSV